MRFWLWKKKDPEIQNKNRKVQRDIQYEKSGKSRQLRENWSQQLQHKQVPKRNGRRNQVPGRVGVSCWHATTNTNSMWGKEHPIFLMASVSLVYIFSHIIMYHILRTLISAKMDYISSLTQLCCKSGPCGTSLNGNHKEGLKAIITY